MLTKTFTRERDTKRTVRFQEEGPEDEQAIGVLYVKKTALQAMGNPEALGVVIGGVGEFEAGDGE
jgi:hypothetical protein